MADPEKPRGNVVNDEGRHPPNWRGPHERGWREGDPKGDSVVPGQDAGAGRQVDDGPGRGSGGAGKATPPPR